ncbi:helix-turn-helix domain-containing protein [Blautia wexlerae]|jgi:DNA-binding XRE family transcriptional regulator|uniref:XRE family transcriptional regulator n=6 Tax=Lachnospiraceae TaxID=186803 RepID=A0A3E5ANQ0_9FIRM|nr:helix-turn-helix transcriptional regulator [Blautia faecis]MBR9939879.1 helix-turn-helix transcriptional regulator [Lachnospiraceae bacterium Marseille-Q4251]MCB6624059.1 helix-turn-helix domain-containing protein [Blautia sp. 210702-DFI.1.159]MZL32441.1 helix-turn-helix domain-containing protein [Blautia wexlerae]NSG11134.1 helix-turn-helix transcriptional regulator [Blautia producta]PLT73957.1 XRE family transcriptional regulator [Mediterraneibacter gnavus]RGD03801.1 XRE family transcrip
MELAAVLGISLRTYQRIEYGQQKPNVYVVVRLQRLFQKDISEIMEEYTE